MTRFRSLLLIRILLPLLASTLSEISSAQIQTQPTEIIRATPLNAFSERAGFWPVQVLSGDVTAAEIEPLTRALNTVPGLQARREGSPTLSIRGSSQGARTLRLYDSIPLIFADGFGAPEALIPEELLGELRLIKGPASVFYGPYAMAGALNHIPRLFERPALRLAVADQDGGISTKNATVVVPFHFKDGDLLQVSAFTENRPGDFPYESVSSGLRGRRVNNQTQTNRYTLIGEQTRGHLTFRQRVIHADWLGTNPNIVTLPSPSSFQRHSTLFSTEVRGRPGTADDWGLQLSHLRHFSRDLSAVLSSSSDASRTLGAIDFNHVFDNRLRARTFVDLSYDTLNSRGFGDANYHQSNFELGEILEVPLGGRWSLQPGVRWLSRHGRLYSSTALVREDDQIRTWLTYSEGFRAPSLYDRFLRTSITHPNPSLKPESSRQIEVGALGKPRVQHRTYIEGLTWSANLYAIEYRNFFDNQPIASGVTTKVNRGESSAFGGETSLGLAEGTRTYTLGYAHLQGKTRATSEPLVLAPRHQLTTSVTQGLGPALLELRHTYTSQIYDRPYGSSTLTAIPDWASLDLSVRTIGLTDWEFKAGIDNLFDRPHERTLGFPEPQRTFYFSGLRYY